MLKMYSLPDLTLSKRPSSFFSELLTLPENKGGNVLLKKYPAQVRTICIADSAELLDADTPQVLQQLEVLAQQKG